MTNRWVLAAVAWFAPAVTWLFALLWARKWPAGLARLECRNKCQIMQLVQSASPYTSGASLHALLDQCYALGPFAALWAVEGLGKDLAEEAIAADPRVRGLLTGSTLDHPRWRNAQLMLHAGMGLGFAKHVMEKLPAQPGAAALNTAVEDVVRLCRENSWTGYLGAAVESIGLVSRFLRDAQFCRLVSQALSAREPAMDAYFWRGVGRSLYFHPSNFLPPRNLACCRAIAMSRREAPSEEARQGMLSGIAWATTVVNMATPEVMEWVLANHADYEADDPAFRNGMLSALVMRIDTTPDDPLIEAFSNHRPAGQLARARWSGTVTNAVTGALCHVHPVLSQQGRLDEVFRFHPSGALAGWLAKDRHA